MSPVVRILKCLVNASTKDDMIQHWPMMLVFVSVVTYSMALFMIHIQAVAVLVTLLWSGTKHTH